MAINDLVLAMTGASGAPYALRLLEVLLRAGRTVHFTISPAGAEVLLHEMDVRLNLARLQLRDLLGSRADGTALAQFQYHGHQDFGSGIASGSFLTGGMVICPASMGTVAAVAHGLSQNLIHRAADVHLKERRKLILVPRETPLSLVQLDNMRRCCEAGAVVLPAMPGFYHRVESIRDLVDFVVARICDQLGVEHSLMHRWGEG